MRAVVAHVPVIHVGYLKLFKRIGDMDLYVLSEEFLAESPILERDMRALSPDVIVSFAKTLPGLGYAGLLTKENLHNLARYPEIVLPDEDVSRAFAERHLTDLKERLVFESVFLRWDRIASTMSRPVMNVTERTLHETEHAMLTIAIDVAKHSSDWWRRVGAVACRDGKILVAKCNHHYPSEHSPYIVGDPRSNFNAGEFIDHSTALHAEVGLAAAAASSSTLSLLGSDVFVTTFPCPPCATLLANCGIRRLFFFEGYSLIAAQEILEAKGVEIIHVVL